MARRGVELSMNLVVISAILLLVMVAIIFVFSGGLQRISKLLGHEITPAENDHDNDGIADIADSCPCDNTNKCNPLDPVSRNCLEPAAKKP